MDGHSVEIQVRRADGSWTKRECVSDGSYLIFDLLPGEDAFRAIALAAETDYTPVFVGIAVVVSAIAVILLKKKKAPAAARQESPEHP